MADIEPTRGTPDLERHREYLRILARTQLDRDIGQKVDASDLVQETMIKAHRSMDQLAGHESAQVAGWLRAILANTIADTIRKYRRDKRDIALERSVQASLDDSSVRLESWLYADATSPSSRLGKEEQFSRLAAAMDLLPDDQRTALELHHIANHSLAETAQIMNRTPQSVAGLLRRGLVALRQHLNTDRYS